MRMAPPHQRQYADRNAEACGICLMGLGQRVDMVAGVVKAVTVTTGGRNLLQ